MKTYIIFWNPDNKWYGLKTLVYKIDDGICGDPSFARPWGLTCNKDMNKGDRFFIICTKENWPKGIKVYDNLKSTKDSNLGKGPHADKFYNLDGVCFGGYFTSAPYELDNEGEMVTVVDLCFDFAVLPGLFPIIHLSQLKKEIPNFDWTPKVGESLIEGEEEKRFSEIISKWMMSSNMGDSEFTNFTYRNLSIAHKNLFGE